MQTLHNAAQSQDIRTKRYLFPQTVLWKAGSVSGEDKLFQDTILQITTNEPDCLILKNDHEANAALLIDFGIEFAGGIRILTEMCHGNASPSLRITFGESAAEAMSNLGDYNATNDHAIRDMTVRLSSFSDQEFGQTGFRFVHLELLDNDCAVRITQVRGVSVMRDIPYLGSFECSDPLLNRIYDTCAYTCHLCMQNMLWDGIKRDRLVWVGDMHPEMLAIRTIFGADPCVEQGLAFCADKFPPPAYPNGITTYAMWWIHIAWDWYQYTGNIEFVNSNQPYITAILAQLCDLVSDDGTDNLDDYFFDWPTKDRPEAVAGVRALFFLCLKEGAHLCRLIGRGSISDICDQKAAALNQCIPSAGSSKQATALQILAGQLPKESATRLLEDGAHGLSTFMSYYILSALTSAGHVADAHQILKTYYGGMLDAGATTFWEDFDINWYHKTSRIDQYPQNPSDNIHGLNGAHCYSGYRHSLCHGWASAPAAFLAESVLGVHIAEPGCRKILLRPQLGGMTWAKGAYPTPHGVLTIRHEKLPDGTIRTEYDTPPGVTVVEVKSV